MTKFATLLQHGVASRKLEKWASVMNFRATQLGTTDTFGLSPAEISKIKGAYFHAHGKAEREADTILSRNGVVVDRSELEVPKEVVNPLEPLNADDPTFIQPRRPVESHRVASETSVQGFDILYAPVVLAPPVTVYVIKRGLEGADRTNALLSYLGDEFSLQVDPVEMFDEDYRLETPCGCSLFVTFRMEEKPTLLGSFRLRREPPGLRADLECTPCETHEPESWNTHPRDHRDWNGTFTAWSHNPKRKDAYEAE